LGWSVGSARDGNWSSRPHSLRSANAAHVWFRAAFDDSSAVSCDPIDRNELSVSEQPGPGRGRCRWFLSEGHRSGLLSKAGELDDAVIVLFPARGLAPRGCSLLKNTSRLHNCASLQLSVADFAYFDRWRWFGRRFRRCGDRKVIFGRMLAGSFLDMLVCHVVHLLLLDTFVSDVSPACDHGF
jgi:hypothetical protein